MLAAPVLSFGVTVLPDPPASRLVELLQLAERHGFQYGWTYDSHVLWQEPYPLLTMAGLATSSLHLGLNVTNPGTREPTVTASAFATLQDITGGRSTRTTARSTSSISRTVAGATRRASATPPGRPIARPRTGSPSTRRAARIAASTAGTRSSSRSRTGR